MIMVTGAAMVLCATLSAEGVNKSMADKNELKTKLSGEEYAVMCENATEPPFKNAYWNNHQPGIYVNAATGEPLFSSTDKFDSGTGWPSFTRPLKKENIQEKPDTSLGAERTEVRSAAGDLHLGHVFSDGPKPSGARYCINSASLRFIPVHDLAKAGYGAYLPLFIHTEKAAFAAGCFWGTQSEFDRLPGVKRTTVGYMGGTKKNPTYEVVCTGRTGHAETVLVEYDPSVISYGQLLDAFWKLHDPTTVDRQGLDRGSQYRSVVFCYTAAQEKAAKEAKERLARSKTFSAPIVTEIVPAKKFYTAEEYHQEYNKKHGSGAQCGIRH